MTKNNVNAHINLLGLKCIDRVTGLEGIATSVCFDLYGCIQVLLNPRVGTDGKPSDLAWIDVGRLRIINDTPVMDQPNFTIGLVAEGKKGPSEKPLPRG